MKMEDVPQDRGMIDDNRLEICYAVDDEGKYRLAGSAGWEPKNIANGQAWGLIHTAVAEAREKVRCGRASTLLYHMTLHQMSVGLLAKYAGFNRLRVWLHLKPGPFSRLSKDAHKRYADVFGITVRELMAIPAKADGVPESNQKG